MSYRGLNNEELGQLIEKLEARIEELEARIEELTPTPSPQPTKEECEEARQELWHIHDTINFGRDTPSRFLADLEDGLKGFIEDLVEKLPEYEEGTE